MRSNGVPRAPRIRHGCSGPNALRAVSHGRHSIASRLLFHDFTPYSATVKAGPSEPAMPVQGHFRHPGRSASSKWTAARLGRAKQSNQQCPLTSLSKYPGHLSFLLPKPRFLVLRPSRPRQSGPNGRLFAPSGTFLPLLSMQSEKPIHFAHVPLGLRSKELSISRRVTSDARRRSPRQGRHAGNDRRSDDSAADDSTAATARRSQPGQPTPPSKSFTVQHRIRLWWICSGLVPVSSRTQQAGPGGKFVGREIDRPWFVPVEPSWRC